MMAEIVLIQEAVSKVFGDLVSKVVCDGVDVLKSTVKDADLEGKSYNQNLQTRLYQLTVDALNRFTHNKYDKQDKLYDAAESILKVYISTQNNLGAVKSALKTLDPDVNNVTLQDFLGILCGEICKADNSDLYREIDMLWKREESKYIHEGFEKADQNDRKIFGQLNDLKEALDFIKGNINSQEGYRTGKYEVPVENRAAKYANKWNSNVFLNNFNERDENAKGKVNIKLRDIYTKEQLPYYKWGENENQLYDLRKLLSEYIIDIDEKKMLLILGQPGIGKSTLITWIMANLAKGNDNILVYEFASDLKTVNWQGDGILIKIFETIHCSEWENRVLILDGFDEIQVGSDREKILNKLKREVEEMKKKFSLIITCRENYIHELEKIECDYITLQAWGRNQIRSFCKIYEKKSGTKNSETKISKLLENQEIFGIPLILYMVLALNISIEKNESIVDIYDQIFSLDGGSIYDRCVKNLRYAAEHRISEPKIKQQIHKVSQRIAFWMFENNPEKAFIRQKDFKEICDMVIDKKDKEIQEDVLIGSYFEVIKHCEGVKTDEMHFIHRSIYEYFVTIYFFESICNLKSEEEIAGTLGELLKSGHLSEQILEFMKYKFAGVQEGNFPDSIKGIFQIMLQNGMTYYTKERYRNMIERERTVFSNMIKFVGIWNLTFGEMEGRIAVYLQCNREAGLNLKGIILKEVNAGTAYQAGIDLAGANLMGAELTGADFNEADLSNAKLEGAILDEADLSRTNLSGADLSDASLKGADLSGSVLKRANLCRANLFRADLGEANLSGADLGEANLNAANLSKANLSGTYLGAADISGADISEANIREANLSGSDLSGTNLSRAYLYGANISGADISGANISEANIREAKLCEANLREANLAGVNLNGANLRGANLRKADLREANLIGANINGANLSGANLYETIFDSKQVELLYEKYDLKDSSVCVSGRGKNISYMEYCMKKSQDL